MAIVLELNEQNIFETRQNCSYVNVIKNYLNTVQGHT